ncbi:LysR family transcriptional regulator [Pseudohoeflea suaedae]|uniref:LysR family transcriptional regulator n=1 Tax=Pseudohoeflea suaedae TaxID=877384 RepID=A0A4R5PL11_9HYPH|nr:LysR family transcriptional regulator [Pseudohoeflea suaedae]TDH37610.1 LysR family transcriptional regulator [Pseudohoeflea suaedae]
MQDLDWNLLKSFLAVVETGSLTAAARRLEASQPTLGRHVAELEGRIGATLLRRTPQGQEVTEAGAAFLADIRAMRDASDAILRRAAGGGRDVRGTVRITASVVIGSLVLPRIVAGLRRQHPELEIEIVATDSVDNLLRRDADIAIRMVKPAQVDLVTRHIGDIPLVAGARRDYFERRGRPNTASDLLEHDVLGFDRDDALQRGFAAFGVAIDRSFFRIRSDNHLVLWQALRQGAGIGFAQKPLFEAEPDLETVLPDLRIPSLPVWLTAHRDIRHAPRISAVLDGLEEGLTAYIAGEWARSL